MQLLTIEESISLQGVEAVNVPSHSGKYIKYILHCDVQSISSVVLQVLTAPNTWVLASHQPYPGISTSTGQ